ncbi:hypothetical protein Avbf_03367 [Armadillidium vulgare]|nr:hypothetical protein Avbf_03367 [Armadillidium vulgare]
MLVNLNVVAQDHCRPLHYSMSQRNHESSRLLLENGADPNAEVLYPVHEKIHLPSFKSRNNIESKIDLIFHHFDLKQFSHTSIHMNSNQNKNFAKYNNICNCYLSSA